MHERATLLTAHARRITIRTHITMSNTEPMPTARIEHDDRARDRRDRESAAQNPYVITSAFRTLQVLQAWPV